MSHSLTTRRNFLKSSLAAATVPYLFSATSMAQDLPPSERVPIGLIGAGGMGRGNMRAAKSMCNVVAIADVDSKRREGANSELSGGKATLHNDYREILDNKDIKVVHIATPDHWHTKPLIEAMLAGKDIYCEKPLTLTIDEGKLIQKVQRETGRIVQVGTQRRSMFNLFVKAIAMVQQGRLGTIRKIQVAIGGGFTCDSIPIANVPEGLDWDRWLGPAPSADYRFRSGGYLNRGDTNCHYNYRWWYEYSGGKLTDWGAHLVDIAKWALEANGQTGDPLSIGGVAKHPVEFKDGMPVERDRYNTATEFSLTAEFPGGAEVVLRHDTDRGCLIEGTKGRIFVNKGKLVGAPVEALEDDPLPEDAIQKAYRGLPMYFDDRVGHWANFFHCVRERAEPISDIHSHMRGLNICHLAGISARLGRKIHWDAEKQEIKGDDQANAMLAREYRKGFEIEM